MPSTHPLGIRPFGNFFFDREEERRSDGLGDLAFLSDAFLLRVLDDLDARSLARVSLVSKIFRCFSSSEELWKKLVLEVSAQLLYEGKHVLSKEWEGNFEFRGNWRYAYASIRSGVRIQQSNAVHPVKGFHSDLLYQPWFCAHLEIPQEWLVTDNISRCSRMSLSKFRRTFEEPNLPVVIEGLTDSWEARTLWSRDFFKRCFKDKRVLVGNYKMTFNNYLNYCDEQHDEMPLYLFDKEVFHRCPELDMHYTIPDIFSEDLFSYLDNRPDHKSRSMCDFPLDDDDV